MKRKVYKTPHTNVVNIQYTSIIALHRMRNSYNCFLASGSSHIRKLS